MDKRFNAPLYNIPYYQNLNNKLEREVGNYLRSKVSNPKNYSNDLRHQYVSALYSMNKGKKKSDMLGRLNEIFNVSEAEAGNMYDKKIDMYNNKIGNEYGERYKNLTNKQLLDKLFADYYINRNNRIREIGF